MLFILIIIPFIGCVFSQDFIQEPDIIQVGEYANLISVLNASNYLDLFKKYEFKWYELNNKYFIGDIKNDEIHNNHNPKKFKIFIIDDKLILQIKNITKNDKKYKFLCYYVDEMEYEYKNIFFLKSLNFFNPFSFKNMKIEYFSNNININFEKIFPIPKCFVKINNEYFFPENNIQNKTLDYLYSQVNLSMEINYSDEIEIICDLLKKNVTIETINTTYLFNQKQDVIQLEEYTNLIVTIPIGLPKDMFKIFSSNWFQNNVSKINSFIIDNKIILQIKNITEKEKTDEFKYQYSYNPGVFKNIFTKLNSSKFVNLLSENNMNFKYLNTTDSTQIHITFEKIFPIPKCFLKINDKIIFFENITTKIDYLYSQVNLSIEIKEINCLEKIICTLFDKNFIIDSTNNICLLKNNLTNSITVVIIILFLISGIILLIFIYFKRKKPSERKEILYSLINKIKK